MSFISIAHFSVHYLVVNTTISMGFFPDSKLKTANLRHIHTMKVMRIGSELIRIVCIHTECVLTAIRIECAFSKSTSIGGLKAV